MTKKQTRWVRGLVAILFIGLGIGTKQELSDWFTHLYESRTAQSLIHQVEEQEDKKRSESPATDTLDYDKQPYYELASLDFQNGENAVLAVGNGKATLDISEWKENNIVYGDLDELNRTTYVTAHIDKKNLGRSEGRDRQVWKPTGWHQKRIDGKEIVNRGHLLAYTSSFNFDVDGNFKEGEAGSQDNPKNLATQTAFSNQQVQTYYEKLVRDAQKIEGNKVLFQIVTVFRGNELMPRGYWLQAIDSAGTLNFNVQPNVVFNYADGTSQIDRNFHVTWKQ